MATDVLVLSSVLLGVLVLAMGCEDFGTRNDQQTFSRDADMNQVESILKEFLTSQDDRLQAVRPLLEGVDLFKGPRNKIDADTWVVGQWIVMRTRGGFRATASNTMYQSERELEIFIIEITLERKGQGLVVSQFVAQMKLCYR